MQRVVLYLVSGVRTCVTIFPPRTLVTRANTIHTRTLAEPRENSDTTFVKRSGTFNLPQSECCDGARCPTRYIY